MNTWKLPRIRWKATLLSAGLYGMAWIASWLLFLPCEETLGFNTFVCNSGISLSVSGLIFLVLGIFRHHRFSEWAVVVGSTMLVSFLYGRLYCFVFPSSLDCHVHPRWDELPLIILSFSFVHVLFIVLGKLPVWGFLLSRQAWRRWKARREENREERTDGRSGNAEGALDRED